MYDRVLLFKSFLCLDSFRMLFCSFSKLICHFLVITKIWTIFFQVQVDLIQVDTLPAPKVECNLEEILKSPAERQAVKDLRENQKMGHFTRQMIYKRTEKEWKSIPKSYPIAPPRP